jgi:hypothetical protein
VVEDPGGVAAVRLAGHQGPAGGYLEGAGLNCLTQGRSVWPTTSRAPVRARRRRRGP